MMSFLQGKIGRDGHYYEERMHPSGQTYVVRDGNSRDIPSGLTSDPNHTGNFMDSVGGHNVRNPHENSGGNLFDALSNLGGGSKNDKNDKPGGGWFDF